MTNIILKHFSIFLYCNYTYCIFISLSAYLYPQRTSQDLAKHPKHFGSFYIRREKILEVNNTGIKSQLKTLHQSCMISKIVYISKFY